jgi:N-methylhydantoinase A/oxoprolinase/acetone carboxylase beta subunit
MERAIRVVSVERGHDPRAFVLVAFGGAGGMHAGEIATDISMRTVVVPRHAGVLSALGMLLADVTRDYSAAVLRPTARLDSGDLRRRFAPLLLRATRDLRSDGFPERRQRITRRLDVRYAGQSHEITVDWTPRFERDFHRAHARRYGYADPARPTEVVALRVVATGLVGAMPLPCSPSRRAAVPRPYDRRPAWFGGRKWTASMYEWEAMRAGMRAVGPAVIAGHEATVVVPPGFRFTIDGFGNVRLVNVGRVK